ncbi:sialate O-acetylesterase, partial [Psychroserpens sp.]|uniref:sialate O-acetylesterase n=1 Tax=Psychroserpens sp. TaxID=2020870 RepID=UPI003C73EEAF
MKKNLIYLLFFIPSVCLGQTKKERIKVVLLAGQSNMNGFGYNQDLPKDLNKTFEDVYIFHGNSKEDENPDGGRGIWEQLKPGHGAGSSSTDKENYLSDRFGIELSFAKRLKERYPNEKIALIKYAREGTSIDSLAGSHFGSWDMYYTGETGINQYDHCLTTIKNAFKIRDIDGNGIDDELTPIGIIWMQGESDASFTELIALDYFDNLSTLINLLRASLRLDDLPVVIGKISDSQIEGSNGRVWQYGELVQYAQEKFVKYDQHASIVRST